MRRFKLNDPYICPYCQFLFLDLLKIPVHNFTPSFIKVDKDNRSGKVELVMSKAVREYMDKNDGIKIEVRSMRLDKN